MLLSWPWICCRETPWRERQETCEGEELKIYLRLLGFVRPYVRRLAGAVACMGVYSALSGALAWLVKPVVDRIFVEQDAAMLAVLPLAVLGVSVGKGLADYGQAYLMAWVGQRVIADVREGVYGHLQDLSLAFFHRNPTGQLISRITNDVNLLHGTVTDAVTGFLKDVLTIVALVGVIFHNDWLLATVSLLVFPVAVAPLSKMGRRIRGFSRRSQVQMGSLTTILHEVLSGQSIVKAFCQEQREKERFSRENRALFRTLMKRYRIRALSSPLMETLGGIGAAAAIYVGGYRVLHGEMTPGAFFSFIAALGMLYEPIKRLNKINLLVQEGMAAAERIFQVLDQEPEVREMPGAVVLPPLVEAVELREVSFGYGAEPVLCDVNLTIRKGEVVALVGESGGGKTTLAHLIPRFFDPTQGAVLVDGEDVRNVTLSSLRGQIALVTQHTVLFNDTVLNNIAYGRPEASMEEIQAAAIAANAHGFIEMLPEGYQTVIGEAGVKLSGGQRQRLCIARALLKDAPILILDEATSSLDSDSEEEVQRALEVLMKGRTVLVIAHRISTVRNAHRIVVLRGGRIVEEGTHDTLMDLEGEYARLYRIQASSMSRDQMITSRTAGETR
jgi:subfamily B ATP-binding cassette protein MsbA